MTDYDRTELPTGYDRARDHGPEVVDLWMRTVAEHVQGRDINSILDLGCGTGRFSEGLAAQFNAEVIGLDPSIKMLERAREKRRDARVRYEHGRAEAIPLRSGSSSCRCRCITSLTPLPRRESVAGCCREREVSPFGQELVNESHRIRTF